MNLSQLRVSIMRQHIKCAHSGQLERRFNALRLRKAPQYRICFGRFKGHPYHVIALISGHVYQRGVEFIFPFLWPAEMYSIYTDYRRAALQGAAWLVTLQTWTAKAFRCTALHKSD